MSLQPDPQVRIEWRVASADDLEAEWRHATCCAGLHPSADPPAPAVEIDDEWWPGRCIP